MNDFMLLLVNFFLVRHSLISGRQEKLDAFLPTKERRDEGKKEGDEEGMESDRHRQRER